MDLESHYSQSSGSRRSFSRGSSASAYSQSSGSLSSFPELRFRCDSSEQRCIASIPLPARIICMAMAGDVAYVGCESGDIQIVDAQFQLIGCGLSSAMVKALAIDHLTFYVYSGHQDGKIRMWRCPCHRHLRALKRWTTLPTVKDQLKNLIRSTSDKPLHRESGIGLTTRTRSGGATWIRHVDAVTCLAVSPESESECDRFLYSGSWDKSVKVWKIGGGGGGGAGFECVESLDAHQDAVNAMVRGAHGMLFTGSADGTVKAWRFRGWGRKGKGKWSFRWRGSAHCAHHQLIATLRSPHESGAVNALALSPDESVLYSATSKCVNLWVIDDMSLQICYEGSLWGHRRSVLCVGTIGKFVCSGSADKTLRIWRRDECGSVQRHSCVAVLEGHTAPVKCLALTFPDNDVEEEKYEAVANDVGTFVVYSGSFDGSVRVWCVNSTPSSRV